MLDRERVVHLKSFQPLFLCKGICLVRLLLRTVPRHTAIEADCHGTVPVIPETGFEQVRTYIHHPCRSRHHVTVGDETLL